MISLVRILIIKNKRTIMDEYIIEIARHVDVARQKWDSNADEFNQWGSLSTSEQHTLIGKELS